MNRRLAMYAAAMLLLALAWFYLAWRPYSAKVKSVDALAEQTRRELDEVSRFTRDLPEFMEAQQQMEAQQIDLNSRLYSRAELLSLLEELQSDASSHGLRVIEVTPPVEELLLLNRKTRRGTEPQYLNLDITVAGPFISLGNFVQTVEESDFSRGINRCIITGSRDRSEPLRMQLGFRALLGSEGNS